MFSLPRQAYWTGEAYTFRQASFIFGKQQQIGQSIANTKVLQMVTSSILCSESNNTAVEFTL
jgi:hypothetical protein